MKIEITVDEAKEYIRLVEELQNNIDNSKFKWLAAYDLSWYYTNLIDECYTVVDVLNNIDKHIAEKNRLKKLLNK